jgi:LEA14-like dessication related protein
MFGVKFLRRNARLGVLVTAVLGVAVGGAFATGLVGTPSVTDVHNEFGAVNETTTSIETDIDVSNPLPVGVSTDDLTVRYAVDMNDVRMATGQKEGISVAAGTTTVSTTTTLSNERIPDWWVTHLRNDEHTTLTVDAAVHSGMANESVDAPAVRRDVDTDLLSGFNSTETRPVEANQPPISDPVLYINETRAHWGPVTAETTTLNATFTVYNPKPYPVGVTELGYVTTMNDLEVGSGTTDTEYLIPPHSTRTIRTATHIDNGKLDEWWVTHLERNQRTDLRISFHARLDTRAGTVTMPLDPLTHTRTIETDIFGTKSNTSTTPATPTTAAETSTDATGESPSPTREAASTTTEPTADGGLFGGPQADTATPTPTPASTSHAPTPSDDGTSTPSSDGTSTTSSENETTTDDGLL